MAFSVQFLNAFFLKQLLLFIKWCLDKWTLKVEKKLTMRLWAYFLFFSPDIILNNVLYKKTPPKPKTISFGKFYKWLREQDKVFIPCHLYFIGRKNLLWFFFFSLNVNLFDCRKANYLNKRWLCLALMASALLPYIFALICIRTTFTQ